MKSPILGSTYVARSTNAACSRMVNLFPEIIPEGGKEPAFLNRAPGLQLLTTLGTGPVRGMRTVGDYCYVVSGQELYKIDSIYNSTYLGFVDSYGPVSMSDNGIELFVAANGPGYIYNVNTGVFSQITSADFLGAVTVGYIDGYFVFNVPNGETFQISGLFDGLTYDATEVALSDVLSDELVGLITDHREIWLFGKSSIEVWYNSGAQDFPFDRIQGATSEIGCIAPYSIAKMDNGVFWLGGDARGQGIVYRTNGYTGQRISTHAVEWQIQKYADMSDAIGYTYQQDGHSFYVLTFPTAGATWVYDASTQAWHERASWINSEFNRHRSNCYSLFNNKNIVGDFENGNLYALNLDVFADNDQPQRWLRSWRALPVGTGALKRTAHHSLQVDMESGTGLVTGQGSDPKVMLRWSDDGGHTWSNDHWMSTGSIGEFSRRVIFRRLGMTQKLRDRVYELSGTDPVKIAMLGAELSAEETRA